MVLLLLLFFPLIAFAVLVFMDTNFLMSMYEIGPFFGYKGIFSLLEISVVFFIVYLFLIYIYLAGINLSSKKQIAYLERENIQLKSDLYSEQEVLLDKLMNQYEIKMNNLEKMIDAKLERVVKFNEYTLDKVIASTQGDFDKYKKETKKLLAQAEIKDKTLLEKLKMWE